MVTVYTSGCHSPFIFSESLSGGSSLVYSGYPNVDVDADKTDVLHLAAEGYVNCQLNSGGDPVGKPSAAGIAIVQRGFVELPTFPLEPDSVSVREFVNILSSDLDSEESLQRLVTDLFYRPDVAFQYFHTAGSQDNQFIKAAIDKGDLLTIQYEKFYYKNPKAIKDFFHIPGARSGKFHFDWEHDLVEAGPEYIRRQIKLSEPKRIELEARHRIHHEQLYREQLRTKQNQVDVFLSYASADQMEADRLYADIIAAGGTVFLAKKSLTPGEDFAERIREALKAAREVWLLLSPASLKSEWVLTEWGAAWVLEKGIVPILHRCSPGDLPQRLSKLHCIDLYRVGELIGSRFSKQRP